ncbi:TATA element modulatory factor 1 TATA binding-domain-containing protein [Pyronema domesticum]|nr:TATA element modulatory factor 1 TATA binding-domain-containing protein [Pyronema domesticum]
MNFLQKGLAGLESRLDKVLLDAGDPSLQREREQQLQRQPERQRMSMEARRSGDVRRSGESTRSTMQERLAAAIGGKTGSGRSSPKIAEKEVKAEEKTEDSKDAEGTGTDATATATPPTETSATTTPPATEATDTATTAIAPPPIIELAPPTPALNGSFPADAPGFSAPAGTPADDLAALSPEELRAMVTTLQADLLTCETRRFEESQQSQERLDALSSKLLYISTTTASSLHARVGSATGLDKQLAQRDEKIALLIEEGERLSKNELKLNTALKQLRQKLKMVEDGKSKEDQVRDKEWGKKLQEVEKRVVVAEKRAEKVDAQLAAEKEKREKAERERDEARREVKEVEKRVKEAEGRATAKQLEEERKITTELREQLERARSEGVMERERLEGELEELRGKHQRGQEKSRAREAEMRAEVSVMESKLEALRARFEEASSGSAGDAHAKLLRQVETLQTQYAIASENWQGIEGSLLGRVTSLEQERDEVTKKEADTRRKARELNLKHRSLETTLETTTSKLKDLESDLLTSQNLINTLRTRISDAEASTQTAISTALEEARKDFDRELNLRLAEEREKAALAAAASPPPARHSPPPLQTASSLIPPPRPPTVTSATESYFVGFPRTRSISGFATPARSESFPMSPGTGDEDGYPYTYDREPTPSSPHRHPDMMSVSTVAAGPSVQLIERMSASVRRLESEMAASREELARVQGQRDEGRKEILRLMEEVEGSKGAKEEFEGMKDRLDRALEMLGEKTERVEELEQDVSDLKEMYKELVLSTSGR